MLDQTDVLIFSRSFLLSYVNLFASFNCSWVECKGKFKKKKIKWVKKELELCVWVLKTCEAVMVLCVLIMDKCCKDSF